GGIDDLIGPGREEAADIHGRAEEGAAALIANALGHFHDVGEPVVNVQRQAGGSVGGPTLPVAVESEHGNEGDGYGDTGGGGRGLVADDGGVSAGQGGLRGVDGQGGLGRAGEIGPVELPLIVVRLTAAGNDGEGRARAGESEGVLRLRHDADGHSLRAEFDAAENIAGAGREQGGCARASAIVNDPDEAVAGGFGGGGE